MEKVTQATAASAEESAAASEELSSQAETALAIVARLATMIGGETHRQDPARVAAAQRARISPVRQRAA